MTEAQAIEEAILILWEKEGHGRGDPIPEEDRARFRQFIENRRAAVEQETMAMMMSKVSEGRRYPRRHMVFAFKLLFGAGIIAAIVVAIYSVLR